MAVSYTIVFKCDIMAVIKTIILVYVTKKSKRDGIVFLTKIKIKVIVYSIAEEVI